MTLYEDESVVVKPSLIEGYGVFAKRLFKTGETVLSWNPQRLSKDEVRTIPEDQRRYLNVLEDGTDVLMQIPERYINHSDIPNTRVVDKTDVAVRDIYEGEEVTSSYTFDNTKK